MSEEKRQALARLAETQAEFWNALSEFESLCDVEIDGTKDLTGYTDPSDEDVEEVIEHYAEGAEEA